MHTIIYPKCFEITHNKINVLNLLSDSSDSDSDSHSDSGKIRENDMEVDINLDTNADIYMDNDMYALE